MDSGSEIAQVAARTGVSAHTLRYYERAGLLAPVPRDGAGRRRYSEGDVARVLFLTRLRSTGMPIRSVRRYVDLVAAGDGAAAERLALLEAHRDAVREQLDRVRKDLEVIEAKVDTYRQQVEGKH